MKKEEYARLNLLSEKAINGVVSSDELKEFNYLLNDWNESIEFNVLQGIFIPNSKDL